MRKYKFQIGMILLTASLITGAYLGGNDGKTDESHKKSRWFGFDNSKPPTWSDPKNLEIIKEKYDL